MKLRLIPVLITIVSSSAVLFGGWFAFQSFAMEDPFIKQISAIEHVVDAAADIRRNEAVVRVTLSGDANLRKTVRRIEEAARSALGGRRLVIEAAGAQGSSEALDDLWANALFGVAEAMDTKQYTNIPARLRQLAGEDGALRVTTEMDEKNVYVTLQDGERVKHVILPRQSAPLGVWPNE